MLKRIPGVVDPRVTQVMDFPTLKIDVDRQRAVRFGISQRDVANNMLTSLSGSGQTAPTFFLNPQNGVNYFVAVNTSVDKLEVGQRHPEFPGQPAGAERQSEPSDRDADDDAKRAGDAYRRYRHRASGLGHELDQPLHDPARDQRRRKCGGPRSRLDRRRDQAGDRRGAEGLAVDHQDIPARPERGHGELVPPARVRADPCDRPRLCGAGRAVPVVDRSVHHHDGGAGRTDRHHLDAGLPPARRSTSCR